MDRERDMKADFENLLRSRPFSPIQVATVWGIDWQDGILEGIVKIEEPEIYLYARIVSRVCLPGTDKCLFLAGVVEDDVSDLFQAYPEGGMVDHIAHLWEAILALRPRVRFDYLTITRWFDSLDAVFPIDSSITISL